AAHRYQQAVVSGEINGRNHVSDPGAAGDDGGSMLNHRVLDFARWFVSIVAPKQKATPPSVTEKLDCLCVEHDLATRHRRDLDIRHARSLPHVREHRFKREPLAAIEGPSSHDA